MSVTPSGCLSEPASLLRTMLSTSSTFQSAAGVGSAALALERIYYREAHGNFPRPYAVIVPAPMGGMRSDGSGGSQLWLRGFGVIRVFLAIDTPQKYFTDPTSAEFFALNFMGGVIADIGGVSAVDTNLPIQEIMLDPDTFGETKQQHWNSLGRYYSAWVDVVWNNGAM